MDAALTLGVSQTELENGFYMVDLPMILLKKNQREANERIIRLHIALAPNITEEETLQKLFESLNGPLIDEQEQDNNEFDAEALARLRHKVGG